ncbi:MAG: ferrous iron transport protein B [Anaerolineales bacterium]|nr:ferrous iron transport protein B [Anaerolineales bacterium]
MSSLRVALAGNPNAGKSTIFNALTGSHQHVGNWPGKTVEKKEGHFSHGDQNVKLIDLPGTYSLSAFSLEETIARDFLLTEKPDVVITVVDAANLERNLYLTLQVLELGIPMVVALNMADMAEARGIRINQATLSAQLGVPVVFTVARKGEGINQLVDSMVSLARKGHQIEYAEEIEKEIARLGEIIGEMNAINQHYPARWLAIKLLEEDEEVQERIQTLEGGETLLKTTGISVNYLTHVFDEEVDTIIAGQRYGWINGLVCEACVHEHLEQVSFTDRLDQVLTHRWLGLPIFMGVMWLIFKLTTDVSAPLLDWVDFVLTGPLSRWVSAMLGAVGLGQTWVESLLVDGVIGGVGGVLVFLPVLMTLFFALAVLEDSGYMARAALVMDRFMRPLGLHGKSFLPMLVGFGCTVPAIYATRTLEERRDRILTGLLVPFMSCGARLPVYVLFAGIFFPGYSGQVIFGLYLLGIVMAIGLGIALRHTVFKTKHTSALVMELPPYRLPTAKGIWFYVWERSSAFLKNAWTIILLTSMVIWLLTAIPVGGGEFAKIDMQDSAFARVSGAVAPIFAPLGFDNWQASGALFTGFVAKEVVISTMSQSYGVMEADVVEDATFWEDVKAIAVSFWDAIVDTFKSFLLVFGVDLFDDGGEEQMTELMHAIQVGFTQTSGGHGGLAALAFMVFVLLYTPCAATIAAEKQELGTKWAWVSIVGQFAIAWVAALVVFQGGRLLGLG